jgi:hypothetical protein
VHVVDDTFVRLTVIVIVPAAPVPCWGAIRSCAGWHVETPAAVDVVVPPPVVVVDPVATVVVVDPLAAVVVVPWPFVVVVVAVEPPPSDEQAASSTAPTTTIPASRPDRRPLTSRSLRV